MSYEDFIEHGLDYCDCPDGGLWPNEPTNDRTADPSEPAE